MTHCPPRRGDGKLARGYANNFRGATHLMRLVQGGPAFRAREDLLHWPDRIRIHNDHAWLARFHCSRKSSSKFLGRSHALSLEPKGASNRYEIRTLEIHTDFSSLKMRVLNVTQYTVTLVVKQDDDDGRVLLSRSSQLADVHQQAAVSAERNNCL